jgi:purine-binding chemotaxis protein CheW
VQYVEESMRRLPVEPVPGVPSFVRGTAIIRGEATPILDVGKILDEGGEAGEEARPQGARILTVRSGPDRRVGLLVDEVLGVRSEHDVSSRGLPPLLRDAGERIVADLGRLDGALLTVLRAGVLLPDGVWDELRKREAP